jgi:hypothetical protein
VAERSEHFLRDHRLTVLSSTSSTRGFRRSAAAARSALPGGGVGEVLWPDVAYRRHAGCRALWGSTRQCGAVPHPAGSG